MPDLGGTQRVHRCNGIATGVEQSTGALSRDLASVSDMGELDEALKDLQLRLVDSSREVARMKALTRAASAQATQQLGRARAVVAHAEAVVRKWQAQLGWSGDRSFAAQQLAPTGERESLPFRTRARTGRLQPARRIR